MLVLGAGGGTGLAAVRVAAAPKVLDDLLNRRIVGKVALLP
ncbi:hypothetical protein [Actinomadura sediminis]|uniref:Uncharacterized protein n=1 Tax=Actinomadura sediminis TaxID=1038904 RepID=A0ABW3EZX0_9ACTN